MCVVGLAFVIANLRPFSLEFFCFGLLWTIISIVGSSDLIYGVADEEGIRYRQYFRGKFLGWEEIAIISWTNANVIHVHIKDRGPFLESSRRSRRSVSPGRSCILRNLN